MTWTDLADGIAAELPRLRKGDVLQLRYGRRFVQIAQLEADVYADSVSNGHLRDADKLSTMDERTLAALGWRRPQSPPGYGNWWSTTPWPLRTSDSLHVAQLVATTLRDVHGAPEPARLSYRAFNAQSGEPLVVPALVDLERVG